MTLHDATSASPAPVLKIGAVVVRAVASRQLLVASEDSDGDIVSHSPLEGESLRYLNAAVGGQTWSNCSIDAALPPTDAQMAHPAPPQGGSAEEVVRVDNAVFYTILVIRPKPKTAGELPPFVLPRGSRQYQDADGMWHDARDKEIGDRFAARLEPFARALAREIEEEAGVSGDMLARAQVVELGSMEFASRSKGNYPIHWFLVIPAPADAALLDHTLPEDATALEWVTLQEIKAMAATGEFSAGYVPVIEVALQMLQTKP